MNNILSCEERVAGNGDPSFSVIWLHGLGADGNDFIPVLPYLNLNGLATRFVFPNAPAIPVTINSGMVMPAWYDIRAGDLSTRHDQDGIRLSARQIEGLLTREKERGIPAERIVLAGFSQGGAIALHVGLRHAEQLAGVIALSGARTHPRVVDLPDAARGLHGRTRCGRWLPAASALARPAITATGADPAGVLS